jgi:hypothetical protein
LATAELLERDWNMGADVWSLTRFTELRRTGLEIDGGIPTPRKLHGIELQWLCGKGSQRCKETQAIKIRVLNGDTFFLVLSNSGHAVPEQ